MTLYDDELEKLARTPQAILEVAVPYCANHYASGNVPNQLLQTEDFTQADWTKAGVTVTGDFYADPLGTTLMDRLVFAADNDEVAQDGNEAAAAKTFDVSLWARAGSGTEKVTLRLTTSAAPVETQDVQLTLTTTPARFSVRKAFSGAAGGNPRWKLIRLAGDATGTIGAWGAQLTKGAETFSYRKNTTVRNDASKCAAVDQGDGKRCFYTFPTCQDRPNYLDNRDGPDSHLRVWKYCAKRAPLPLPGEDVLPYMEEFEYAAQVIDPERAVTVSDRITFRMAEDEGPGLWDLVRASEGAKVNTGRGKGAYWKRWVKIHQNYANPLARVVLKAGFVAASFTEALYADRFRGLLRNVEFDGRGRVKLLCQDRLKLAKAKIPARISDANVIRETMTTSQTTLKVTDASEVTQPGSGYTVTIKIDTEEMNVTSIDLPTDTLTLTRGRWGTVAATHAAGSKWQEVIELGTERDTITPQPVALGTNPVDAIRSLLNRAGVADADIDTAKFASERDRWLKTTTDINSGKQSGPLCRRTVSEQTDAEQLIKELRDAYLIFVWVNEKQKITLRVYAPDPPTTAIVELTDDENLLADTVEVDDNQESRLTRILYGWDLTAGKDGEKIEDYNRSLLIIGGDEESDGFYGDERPRVVLNKWLQGFDDAVARSVGRRLLHRFRRGARKIKAEVEIRDDKILVGDTAKLSTARLMDEHGNAASGRLMIVTSKKRVAENRLGLEMLDLGLSLPTAFFAPTGHPTYDNSTAEQRRYAHFTNSQGTVGEAFDEGSRFW